MSSDTILHVVSAFAFAGMIYWGWSQIPPEDPEIVKARAEYGKVDLND